ncbi:aminotransferase class V-fold PLP-dependent enzyme [Bacillus haynesii]|uniref:aminotransferase class V-fold PLP-dependent enzyme n=1 Tax=Bacillus haynesii TaxID=1925021 RepID=UPI00228168C5|nr:aminotransferase class V-fold PLP-dependent enzyme [Bacillus haynesii]MCY8092948.1 aminotransferase class V-fold PLP-dependent enzyme [Bacillus haynesii]MCY8294027.1 aminotransferase class V-fold PLP-dependent enzyme [Bacillus haynesii]MCY8406614.1 aminotransferase class V-fold PLP-dependent enzyme [Bacillus haynesii]MCY8434265.1 aminotransferase class V-fold PLP-dependent enzyme [Bacillus haynesii]MCY8627229.1 aminotransferase class V-fold PLP-dependent enzyme [Bacillus haynesii]
MKHPFHNFRSLFPILSDHVHLAACSGSALALPVAKAVDEYQNGLLTSGADWKAHLGKIDEAKEKFARLIGAEKEEIAVLPSVSDAVTAVAASLPQPLHRRQIAFTDIDFPAVGQIWLAQDRFKDHLIIIQSEDGMINLEQYEKDVTDQTLLTCVPHAGYRNGFKQDIKQIAEIVHQKGSLLFVDAYQTAGHIPIHVKDMDIDILAAGTRKYMLGIPGTAFLYMKREFCGQFEPKTAGWFGRNTPFALNSGFAEGAKRFESGTPAFISIYAADAALKLLLEAEPDRIEPYLRQLAAFSLQYGAKKGLKIKGPGTVHNRTSLISVYAEEAGRIESLLREKHIIVSARNNIIRIAPHFYNTKEEIGFVMDEIAALLG